MFKLYHTLNKDNLAEKREATTGHDRFCYQPKVIVPRYRRKRNHHKRTQEETDLAFELTGYSCDSSTDSPNLNERDASTNRKNSHSHLFRSVSEIQWPNDFHRSVTSINLILEHDPQYLVCPPELANDMFLENHCTDPLHHHHQNPTEGLSYHHYPLEVRQNSSWETISKFFSTVATTLICRNNRKNSEQTNQNSLHHHQLHCLDQTSRPTNYDYNRLGDESGAAEMVELHSPRDELKQHPFPPHSGLIRSEKTAGHTACMNYLKNSNGRYVLVEQLPEIGWRTNRLWYIICDARVNAKRLLVATPCTPRSPLIDSTNKNIMLQVCRALQHPYVCPVLDLETVTVENFDRPFAIVVSPMAARGSLRDVFHECQWSDHWPNKYCRKGAGLTEGHAQRLSCQILQALLELRQRGCPPGIGFHLHPGNVLIQHGTARFSGLDNVLMGHNPRGLPYISRYMKNLEAIDSISFAYLLFAMCTGYEIGMAKLTSQNWNDIRDYTQASQVLEYILENPQNRFPTLKEIANLDFYRTMDLRELRSLPLPHIMAGPPIPSVKILLDHLHSHRLQKRKKSRSASAVCDTIRKSAAPVAELYETQRGLKARSFSISTPSISKTHMFASDSSLLGGHPIEGSACGSSQISVYCTPPSSIHSCTKPSSSSTMESVHP